MLSVTALIFLTSVADAIPAFARKYKLSCSTCHSAIPKLKDFGEEFAANGFMLPSGNEPKRQYVETGDDDLLLQRFLPLAIRFDGFLQLADREKGSLDLEAPYGIKLLSGGPISNYVSYYLYFYMDERGEVAGLEDAFVHFNNLFNTTLDIIVGQFQVSDPLFKRELRLTYEDYLAYKMKPSFSKAKLTYERGVLVSYGFDFGLDVTAEVLNGNGIGEAENRIFDFDNGKTFAFRASQNLGWIRLGGFVYTGSESFEEAGLRLDNTLSMYGPDLTLQAGNFELNLQYLHREDKVSGNSNMNTAMDGGFAELIFFPGGNRSRWILTALYNQIEGPGKMYDYKTATLSVSYLLARNIRLMTEVTHDFLNKKPKLTTGFVTAF
ncbi:MAG: hypothetical protein GXO82_02010 [Chlorobi bacterium]|nr:hypothetical protein [Chlorobiota bacterium]